jgi:hypothetical protein
MFQIEWYLDMEKYSKRHGGEEHIDRRTERQGDKERIRAIKQ